MDPALNADVHLQRMLDIHFDPDGGAPFWLERRRALDFDPRAEVRTVDDLPKLGPMNEDALRRRPVLDFVPRSAWHRLSGAVITETGGASGDSKRTIFSRKEFHAAFVTPFVTVAAVAGFPRGALWLWVGPGGPHVIGQAAAACAAALDSPQPFAIDFDPRWYRKLPPDSLGRQRYLDHLLDQALRIIEHEPVEVIFTTPVLLRALADRMTDEQRYRIRGVHYGGMRVEPDLLQTAQESWFPRAAHLAGYGNSLFGLCMEFGGSPDRVLRYYPFGPRHQVRVDRESRVWMTRLDPTVLIANLRERDAAAPALPPTDGVAQGFGPGVEDPRPAETARQRPDLGIY